MKFFSWLTAIIIILLCTLLTTVISGFVSSNFGLGYSMLIMSIFPLVIIFYFIAWILMWNSGKAESPFKLILEFLS